MAKDDRKMLSVYFDEGETGWVEYLTGDLARVQNIPMGGPYNLHDIVRLDSKHERIVELVAKGYIKRSWVCYDETWQFHNLCSIFRILKAEVEGGVVPSDVSPGYMAVSYSGDMDPQAVATALGYSKKKPIKHRAVKTGERK